MTTKRSEALVKKDLKARFDEWGAWHFMHVPGGYGKNGLHDHMGCVPVTITPNMVGMKLGVFFSVEAKAEGRRGEKHRGMSQGQVDRMTEINAAYGLSTVADCVEDLRLIEQAIGFRRLDD